MLEQYTRQKLNVSLKLDVDTYKYFAEIAQKEQRTLAGLLRKVLEEQRQQAQQPQECSTS